MTSSQWLDLVVLAVAFFAGLSGWRAGALGSLMSFIGVVLGASAERAYLAATGMVLPLGVGTPAAVAVMLLALLGWTLALRRRLPHIARAKHEARHPGTSFVFRERPVDPVVAARSVALAFATSRAGSLLIGLYLGVALMYVDHLHSGDVVLRASFAVVAAALALGLVIVALWLERSCRLPDPPAGAQPAAA